MKKFGVIFLVFIMFSVVCVYGQDLPIKIGIYRIFINDIELNFKSPIVSINGITYAPIRELAENLGYNVGWNNDKTIKIYDDNSTNVKSQLTPFEENGKWGYKDIYGNIIIENIYCSANEFNDGLAMVSKSPGANRLCGYINENGEEVIPCQYYMAYDFSEGVACVSLAEHTDEGRFTYIDKSNKQIFDKEFMWAGSFHNGYALVLKEGSTLSPISKKYSYIDKSGEFATELTFDDALRFFDGFACVKNNEKWGVIDKNFNFVVSCIYDEINVDECGKIMGYINDKWEEIIYIK